jgi:hypothetical protein
VLNLEFDKKFLGWAFIWMFCDNLFQIILCVVTIVPFPPPPKDVNQLLAKLIFCL